MAPRITIEPGAPLTCPDCEGHGEHISGTHPALPGRPCTGLHCEQGIDPRCEHCRDVCCTDYHLVSIDCGDSWGPDTWVCGSWGCAAMLASDLILDAVDEDFRLVPVLASERLEAA